MHPLTGLFIVVILIAGIFLVAGLTLIQPK